MAFETYGAAELLLSGVILDSVPTLLDWSLPLPQVKECQVDIMGTDVVPQEICMQRNFAYGE